MTLVDLLAELGDVKYKTKTRRLSHEDPYFKAEPAEDNSNESAPSTPVSEAEAPKQSAPEPLDEPPAKKPRMEQSGAASSSGPLEVATSREMSEPLELETSKWMSEPLQSTPSPESPRTKGASSSGPAEVVEPRRNPGRKATRTVT